MKEFLAYTGPEADRWSRLKAMDHALARAEVLPPEELEDLDREQLAAVVGMLDAGTLGSAEDTTPLREALARFNASSAERPTEELRKIRTRLAAALADAQAEMMM